MACSIHAWVTARGSARARDYWELPGAARELSEALIINPYDIEQFADAIRNAVEMEPAERQARMERMRRTVEENNIYCWAARFLAELRRWASSGHC